VLFKNRKTRRVLENVGLIRSAIGKMNLDYFASLKNFDGFLLMNFLPALIVFFFLHPYGEIG
jgi:hypothetical protein